MNENKLDYKALISYCINVLMSIIGFLLVSSYNKTNESLAQINHDILLVNKEIVQLKIELVELNSRILSEDRVKEIIKLETSQK